MTEAVDPFAELGLSRDASAAEIRDARRRLAKEHHPDRGGDPDRMRAINEAASTALQQIARTRSAPPPERDSPGGRASDQRSASGGPKVGESGARWSGDRVERDIPSFTIEALPVDAFEGLVLAAAQLGDIVDDDPPYRLEVHVREPAPCWCRLEVVPDAGSSTVSLTVAAVDGFPRPEVESVRDVWVATLNQLEWE